MESFNLLSFQALNASPPQSPSVTLTAAGRDLAVKEEVFAGEVLEQVGVLPVASGSLISNLFSGLLAASSHARDCSSWEPAACSCSCSAAVLCPTHQSLLASCPAGTSLTLDKFVLLTARLSGRGGSVSVEKVMRLGLCTIETHTFLF